MHRLNAQGQQIIAELAQRYAVSSDAVLTLFDAVAAGNGSMAQFSHPDLGGSGQWMQGGMTMVGDMFNYNLKAKVDGLCAELSQLVFRTATCARHRHIRHQRPRWVSPFPSRVASAAAAGQQNWACPAVPGAEPDALCLLSGHPAPGGGQRWTDHGL